MLPIIDLALLREGPAAKQRLAEQLDAACRRFGFFYLVGHDVPIESVQVLMSTARHFFAGPVEHKRAIHMSKGGRAWRGYFQLGEELTSGRPDGKEGIYFGIELDESDPRVRAGTPLHGRNLFPATPDLRAAVLEYMEQQTRLGQQLMSLLALGLGLDENFFREHYTGDPTILFRIFNYPRVLDPADGWGVGEHTDYGFITLLKQDDVGGLQVRHGEGWLEVPAVPNSFVCNVGDMLERLTHGRYLSALHRVRSSAQHDRLSMALFFDPAFDARLTPIAGVGPESDAPHTQVRWDDLDPHAAAPSYGEYLLSKVGRVFPALRDAALKP
ncbi:isopenicillin N synthase family dioxygenase [Steroidobacter sp.]|uniref:isopenicillin N synthase family dioxygenase n=1 Tax=Steroidobacter sp. TaxID=1978227 RepID=UPI001A44253A|nr:2-oxoglutarate and iron-dependent oxygenase domain-containing protein [Steroidobacter sp.]MBL8269516.1 isopenicillin N synthase family oxygenase [Steroidobacter sp.]